MCVCFLLWDKRIRFHRSWCNIVQESQENNVSRNRSDIIQEVSGSNRESPGVSAGGGIYFCSNYLAEWMRGVIIRYNYLANWMGGIDLSKNDLAKWVGGVSICRGKHQLYEVFLLGRFMEFQPLPVNLIGIFLNINTSHL